MECVKRDILQMMETGMDVEIAIRYSGDRPCTVKITRPDDDEIMFMIVTSRAGVPRSLGEGLQEVRRRFAIEPRSNGEPSGHA
jgi:hypothetical protein